MGAGAIGCAVAYYLSLRGIAVTVVEAVGVATGASGKSGGFLASDWCDGQPQEQLAHASFELHADLASALDIDYGYRRLTTLSLATSARNIFSSREKATASPWLDGDYSLRGILGDTATTAQIEPAEFTRALLGAAQASGAKFRIGEVSAVSLDSRRRRIEGVLVGGEHIAADAVVVAMGPWARQAGDWLPLPRVFGSKGYSVILRPPGLCPPEAIFVEYEDEQGGWHNPEIVPRANGEVYVCGFGDRTPVPESPRDVLVDEDACRKLHEVAARVSRALGSARVLRRQACYRPICADAMPIIGAIDGVSGAYVGGGHNCWGMLNAPGTGYALAELIATGESRTIDLGRFAPSRLPPMNDR